MLIDAKKYSFSLKKLWFEVFGDSEEYISLMFEKGYTPSEVFAEISDGKVVSALYLLECNINSGDDVYKGRYLYAAATLADYRKNGIMSKLIDEAKRYVAEEGIVFIALVPASEKLYGYYGKYGFKPLMYKYVSVVKDAGNIKAEDEIIEDTESILEMRRLYCGKIFGFEKPEMKYALSCLNFAGYYAYRNSDDSYYISDKDKTEIVEYISSEINFADNTKLLISKMSADAEISSPYNLSEFCESNMQKFGMIFTENGILKESIKSGIYMNIALD